MFVNKFFLPCKNTLENFKTIIQNTHLKKKFNLKLENILKLLTVFVEFIIHFKIFILESLSGSNNFSFSIA